MLAERNRLEAKLKSIKEQLDIMPDGKLICARNGKGIKWYHSDGKIRTHIKKGERPYAEQLALKKYLTLLSDDLIAEIRSIDFYLRHHPDVNKAEQLLTEKPGYQELLLPYFTSQPDIQSDWLHEPYERNLKHPQYLKHKTSSGNMVRSKSEAMIDYILTTNGIPFRYECALSLGDTIIHPDFTILHPRTDKIFYWEHFGMMDDPSYSKNVGSKLQLYISNGIIPSIQLITTYETSYAPLTIHELETIVRTYFLD